MIKFFRKIRYNLMEQNKTGKYLKYAIGEIALVVIGILIAIQLNDWNQNRIERKEYNLVLLNLQEEFSRSKELLTDISSGYVLSIITNKELMQLFKANNDNFSATRIDTMLGQISKQAPFHPHQPVLNELLNSGNIKSFVFAKLEGGVDAPVVARLGMLLRDDSLLLSSVVFRPK